LILYLSDNLNDDTLDLLLNDLTEDQLHIFKMTTINFIIFELTNPLIQKFDAER
jgi:hypothetical protein